MKALRYKIGDKALTLIEAVLALTLGALVLASLTMVFKTGWQSWKEDSERSELIQHARVAMWRIMDDLRYAQAIDELPTSGSSGSLQFTTENLLSGSGVIRYELLSSELSRVVEGVGSEIAGSPTEGIYVTSLDSTLLKIESGDLVALDADNNPGDAVAVRVDLTLQDADGDSFILSSMAKLRNKTASEEEG